MGTRTLRTVLGVTLGGLSLATAGCSTGGGGAPSPSASTSEGGGPAYISERDLSALFTDEDVPEGLELVIYNLPEDPAFMADFLYSPEYAGAADPEECVELVGAAWLTRTVDADADSSERLLFMFQLGGPGETETNPSIAVWGRLFSSEDRAVEYLSYLKDLSVTCQDGFTYQYGDGEPWEFDSMGSFSETVAFPEVGYLHLSFYLEWPTDSNDLKLVQYRNAVVAIVDESSWTSAPIDSFDLDAVARSIADGLVEVG